MKNVLLNLPMRPYTPSIRDALFRLNQTDLFPSLNVFLLSFFLQYVSGIKFKINLKKKKKHFSVSRSAILPLVLVIMSLCDLQIVVFGFYLHLTHRHNLFGNRVVV